MIARMEKNPEMQASLVRDVQVRNRLVRAESDSGAQVSSIGSGLVGSLGLAKRKLDQEWYVDGINSREHTLIANMCVDITLGIFDGQVTVTCFVVESNSVQNMVLLGLDFISKNMDVAIRWLQEAEFAATGKSTEVKRSDGEIQTLRRTVKIASV